MEIKLTKSQATAIKKARDHYEEARKESQRAAERLYDAQGAYNKVLGEQMGLVGKVGVYSQPWGRATEERRFLIKQVREKYGAIVAIGTRISKKDGKVGLQTVEVLFDNIDRIEDMPDAQ